MAPSGWAVLGLRARTNSGRCRYALPLASAAADLQYSIQFQERVRRLFNAWLSAHIAFSIIFYLLLALHIWAGIYFGLRWFR